MEPTLILAVGATLVAVSGVGCCLNVPHTPTPSASVRATYMMPARR